MVWSSLFVVGMHVPFENEQVCAESHLEGRNHIPQSPSFSTGMDSGNCSVLSLRLGAHPTRGSGVRGEIAR